MIFTHLELEDKYINDVIDYIQSSNMNKLEHSKYSISAGVDVSNIILCDCCHERCSQTKYIVECIEVDFQTVNKQDIHKPLCNRCFRTLDCIFNN